MPRDNPQNIANKRVKACLSMLLQKNSEKTIYGICRTVELFNVANLIDAILAKNFSKIYQGKIKRKGNTRVKGGLIA